MVFQLFPSELQLNFQQELILYISVAFVLITAHTTQTQPSCDEELSLERHKVLRDGSTAEGAMGLLNSCMSRTGLTIGRRYKWKNTSSL